MAEETPQTKADEPALSGLPNLLRWWTQTRIARALARYGTANGALLTGGIAFSSLFSIFAALTVAFAVFSAVLGGNPELQRAVLDALDSALPGIVKDGDNPNGIVSPENLQFPARSSILLGIVFFFVFLNTSTSVPAALRTGIRSMFGVLAIHESPVAAKVRDLGGFVVLALSVVVTAVLGIAVGAAGDALAGAAGLDGSPVARVVLRSLGYVVALAVDFAVVVFLIGGLAGVKPPHRDLIYGALIVAVAATVLRFLGTSAVGGSIASNPVIAPFAAIGVLLLWVNFIVRIMLIVCAWTANPPAVPEADPNEVTHAGETPNYVTESEPDTLAWDHDPHTGRLRPEPAPEPPRYWGGLIGWARRKYRGFREA